MLLVAVHPNALKYISLVTLTLQNAVLGLSMRYGRTRPGDMFLSSTGKARPNLTGCFHCGLQLTHIFVVHAQPSLPPNWSNCSPVW